MNNQYDKNDSADASESADHSDASVLVVIVNYRTPTDTCNTLASLAPELNQLAGMKVVVTDNHSGDDSLEVIGKTIQSEGWDRWAELMPLDTNGGFASGNNAAIRVALASDTPPDYIMLLNPDTLVETGAIARLANFMNRDPDIGIAGANVSLTENRPHTAARRLPSPVGEFIQQLRLGVAARILKKYEVSVPIDHDRDRTDCDWVCGAAMMVRTEVFREIGLMDEGYFLYYEEVDFCGRAKDAGFQVVVEPTSRIVHLEGVATKISDKKKRRARFWYDSRRRFFVKRYGVIGLISADACWSVGYIGGKVIDAIRLRFSNSDPKWFAWDLLIGDALAICSGKPLGKPTQTEI